LCGSFPTSGLKDVAGGRRDRLRNIFSEEETNVTLRITVGETDGVQVLWLEGRIVLGEETSVLRENVKSLIAAGNRKLVLNMGNVTLIDSAGLGALVTAHSSARSSGASLRLCNLGSKFKELMQITRLVTLFDVSTTEAEAIAASRGGKD
jgi:anti-sigma B factor antagonist